jgi:hypothetical protein
MPAPRAASCVHASKACPAIRASRKAEGAKMVEMRVHLDAVRERQHDDDARIRELEAAMAKLKGACLLLATVAGSASGWLALLLTHH